MIIDLAWVCFTLGIVVGGLIAVVILIITVYVVRKVENRNRKRKSGVFHGCGLTFDWQKPSDKWITVRN